MTRSSAARLPARSSGRDVSSSINRTASESRGARYWPVRAIASAENCAESLDQPTRRRERQMQCRGSLAGAPRFLSVRSMLYDHPRQRRHLPAPARDAECMAGPFGSGVRCGSKSRSEATVRAPGVRFALPPNHSAMSAAGALGRYCGGRRTECCRLEGCHGRSRTWRCRLRGAAFDTEDPDADRPPQQGFLFRRSASRRLGRLPTQLEAQR
jgi:hypothetical protein